MVFDSETGEIVRQLPGKPAAEEKPKTIDLSPETLRQRFARVTAYIKEDFMKRQGKSLVLLSEIVTKLQESDLPVSLSIKEGAATLSISALKFGIYPHGDHEILIKNSDTPSRYWLRDRYRIVDLLEQFISDVMEVEAKQRLDQEIAEKYTVQPKNAPVVTPRTKTTFPKAD